MTSAKHTKKALLASVMSILLCCAMLIGTTFAWFTDSASSGNNRLQAGKLDIALLMATDQGYENISNGTGNLFKDTKWEPGKTEIVYLAVRNDGDLAAIFDCDVITNPVQDSQYKNLGEVLQCAVLADREIGQEVGGSWTELINGLTVGQNLFEKLNVARTVMRDTVVRPGEIKYFAVAVHMNESAGNEYQNAKVDIDVQVNATQAQVESDAFGTSYDANAVYTIANDKDLKQMLSKPVNGATYTLTNNVTLASNVNMNPARKGTSFTIDLNGYNITLNGNNGCTVAKDTTLTVTDFSKTGSGSMTHTGSGYMFLANRDVTFILNDNDNRCTTSGKGLITNL